MLLLSCTGTILKATVDYIRKMQRDMDRYRAHEIRTKQMEDSMRLLKLRIQVCGGQGAGVVGGVLVCGGRCRCVMGGVLVCGGQDAGVVGEELACGRRCRCVMGGV